MMKTSQFDAKKYSELFDNWSNAVMISHRNNEIKLIKTVLNRENRLFIDLGAGYGRTEVNIHNYVGEIIAIEIDRGMYKALVNNTKKFKNVQPILGDITKLMIILKNIELDHPVILLLENTLGSVVGNWKDIVKQIRETVEERGGELILSLYRKRALPDWGLMSYWYGKEMNGEPDMKKTDFDKGIFVSKTGYISKWWGDEDIELIKKRLKLRTIREIVKNEYWVMHLG